jgi:deoxyribonuclease (pyrimidine dimer)
MTRINCIPSQHLLDEHLSAAVREGGRPINEVRSGKDNVKGAPSNWKLGKGHVLFCKKHLTWTHNQYLTAKGEYYKRGFKGFDYTVPLDGIPERFLVDYTPSDAELRTNLARICERWRKRKKPYHFHGKVIDTNKDFLYYLKHIKLSIGV